MQQTVSARRQKLSGPDAIQSLAESVQAMSAAFAGPSSSSAPSTTPAMATPYERAFQIIATSEGLSPAELALAPRIFRNNPDLVLEYLSFPAHTAEARSLWLQAELALVLNK